MRSSQWPLAVAEGWRAVGATPRSSRAFVQVLLLPLPKKAHEEKGSYHDICGFAVIRESVGVHVVAQRYCE